MSKKDLQTKLAELEAIVAKFDDADLDIAVAMEQFETGNKLAEEIQADLSDLKTKITVLKERFDSPS